MQYTKIEWFPITIIRNIAIEDDVDRGQIRKSIERAIWQIEDEN